MVDSNRNNTGGIEEFSSMSASSSEKSSGAMETGREIASELGEKAGEMAGRASGMASKAGARADEGIHKVGEKLGSLAGSIRERASHGGRVGSAASAVADSLEAGGQYLREHNISDLGGEVSEIAKRYPMATLWVGVGVGFLLGQVLVRRS